MDTGTKIALYITGFGLLAMYWFAPPDIFWFMVAVCIIMALVLNIIYFTVRGILRWIGRQLRHG